MKVLKYISYDASEKDLNSIVKEVDDKHKIISMSLVRKEGLIQKEAVEIFFLVK